MVMFKRVVDINWRLNGKCRTDRCKQRSLAQSQDLGEYEPARSCSYAFDASRTRFSKTR